MRPPNPYLARLASRGKGHAGRKSEKKVAKSVGAKLRPGSGSIVGAKGDMVKHSQEQKWLLEAKSTVASSIRLELDWLRKISSEALETNAAPMLTLSFTNGDGSPVEGGEWVAIPKRLLWTIDGFKA